MEDNECGRTDIIPHHLNTLSHTDQANGQDTKRWFSDSPFKSQIAQEDLPIKTTPLRAKLTRVRSLPKRACQEKTITFDGAQLLQTLAREPAEAKSREDVGQKRL
jgi:hypothetical protein